MYPPEQLISEVLDDVVRETQKQLEDATKVRPMDDEATAEVRFWRSQRNAYTKAQHYFESGVRLVATPSGYTVPSASRPGALVHQLHQAGGVWLCSCEAGDKGILHWHTALVSAYDRADELAQLAMEREDVELEALLDRAAAADILADAADERRAQALDDGWLSDESVADLARRLCEARSRYAA
jgi:hypothetical protein